jgi:hypothetical protein
LNKVVQVVGTFRAPSAESYKPQGHKNAYGYTSSIAAGKTVLIAIKLMVWKK